MNWKRMIFGDFLTRSKIPIEIQDNKTYKRVTIRIKNNGVSIRDQVKGNKIGTKKQFTLKAGQFIVSKIDARYGAFGIAPIEVNNAIITGNFWAYDVDSSKINIEWFNQFTNSKDFYNLCERASSGITHRKYLNEDSFLNNEIYLPDIDEQIKVIENFKLNKKTVNLHSFEFTHQLSLVTQLRQAFLREAMQGKLVEQNLADEPASELLARIKAEKEQLIKEKKIRKQKPLPPIEEEEIPFEIPESWEWCRLGNLASIVRGGSPRPAGDKKYYDGHIPFLKVGDLTGYEGKYCDKHTFTIKEAGLYKTRFVEANTLMLTNSGATLGVPRICTFPTTFNDGIAAFLGIDSMNKEFLFYFLRSKSNYFLNEASRGQGQPNLNTDIISITLIALPPHPEQKRLVGKLDELMNYCDQLEESIKNSQRQNEMLLGQVLREALEPEEVFIDREQEC